MSQFIAGVGLGLWDTFGKIATIFDILRLVMPKSEVFCSKLIEKSQSFDPRLGRKNLVVNLSELGSFH
jgi:hypothetical protein